MKNSLSDRSLLIHSEDDEGEDNDDLNDEEGAKNDDDHDGDESDGSDASSSSSPRHSGSRPNSYTTTWPQSYRQSMDMYSGATPPAIGLLGTPLSRLSNSFLTSSFRGKHSPEITSSLSKPLLPSTAGDLQLLHESRLSTHSLPSRKPSLERIQEDKPSALGHDLPITRTSSYGQAVLNGMNVLIGVGILSAPYAVKEGGWIGLSVLLVFAVLSLYTGFLLRRCLDSEDGLETYPDVGQAAYGTIGRIAVSIILYVELYACCVEYIILESDNLSALFPNAHLDVGGLHLGAHVLFAILTTFVVLPTTWLRDLSILSYISVGGVVASVVIVFCLFWVGAVDHVGFENKGTLLNLSGMPIALGLYGYCYSGHSVFPNIYSSLKDRNQFPSVLYTCFAFCTVLFAGSAVMGYTMFGESTESQFTLNLPKPLVASKIAIWTTVVNPITKYALTLTPLAMSLEELLPSNHMKSEMYPILIRTALVISILVVAVSVPFFGLVLSLIGSLLTMLVTLVVPCVCFLHIFKGKVSSSQVLACIFTILVGVVSCVIGTYSSLSQIVENLH